MKKSALSAQERRKQVYDMRRAGNTWEDIAEISGLRETTCKAYMKAAIAVDGLPDFTDTAVNANALETRNEAAAMDVMVAASEPFSDERFHELREACKKNGLAPRVANGLIQRLKSKYAPVVGELKRLSVEQMSGEFEKKINLVLHYIDEYAISQASAKDLGALLGILVDRHQLLNNRPTAIVDMTTRQQLSELVPAVVEEARRRGISLPPLPMVERVEGPL